MPGARRRYKVAGEYAITPPPPLSNCSKRTKSSRPRQGKLTRFEELGFNYGFHQADTSRLEGYFYVYRCLKDKLDMLGPITRIHADEDEIRLTELEGKYEDREKVKIFNNDISGYYKFDHTNRFVAICIDANTKQKTGFWFLAFERSGQLEAFCSFLNWLFNLDPSDMRDLANPRCSYVDRRSGSLVSVPSPWDGRKNRSYHASISEDSGLPESDSEPSDSSAYLSDSHVSRHDRHNHKRHKSHQHQHHSPRRNRYYSGVSQITGTVKSWRVD